MGDLLTALGIVLVLVVGAWHAGSPLLRVAASCCFLGAGLLLLAAGQGQGDVSLWAAPAVFGWGTACWTLGHCLHRLRRGRWCSPLAARLFSGRLPRRRPRTPPTERPRS